MSTPQDSNERARVLLRAAFDLLRRSQEAHYVQETCGILVRYDEADCDGFCLKEDIANELGIDENEEPIPLSNPTP